MEDYNKFRLPTHSELSALAYLLGEAEFFPDPDHVMEAAEALQCATVLVFPERFPEGHLVVVVWSDDYDDLPKEAEQFMLQGNGGATRIE